MEFLHNFKRAISRKPVNYTRKKVDVKGAIAKLPQTKNVQSTYRPMKKFVPTNYTGSKIVKKK